MNDALVYSIFGEALYRTGPERTGYLERACAGDPGLLSCVEELLAAAEKDDEFLGGVPGGGAPRLGEREGDRIGPYRLVERIGEGGFGTVFLAEQERPVKRRVALKIIKLGMDTRAVVARFEQERQALALMDHANIARVLEAGATGSGRPYFVMDLVAGDPITAYCDRRHLPVRERLGVFGQVCQAVQHAHTKGVIHRDLKPGNVLVTDQDGKPLARVIDFGIAKATGEPISDLTLTGARQMIGTPAYMSPEQAQGGPDVDTRTDVYSLGVMLYELLAGSNPFDGPRLRSASFDEVRRIIREEDPAPPSTRIEQSGANAAGIAEHRAAVPRELRSMVRGELDWIVMRALEKDRSRRYQSAAALQADLERFLSGEPVAAAPPDAWYRVRKFVGRHRVGVGAAAAVGTALVLGTVGTSAGLISARHERDNAVKAEGEKGRLLSEAVDQATRADREAQNARKQTEIASAVNRLLTGMLARADRTKEQGNPNVTVREAMDLAVKELDSKPGAYAPEVESAVRLVIGRTYGALSLFAQAESQLTAALALRRAAYGDDSLEVSDALVERGRLYGRAARGDLGVADLSRALDIRRRLLGEANDRTIVTLTNLANTNVASGNYASAEEQLREVVRLRAGEGVREDPAVAHAMGVLGTLLAATGREAEALEQFQRALDVFRRHPQGNEEGILVALTNVAAAKTELGDFAGALPEFRESLDGLRRLYGADNRQLAIGLGNYGHALRGAGDPEGALGAYVEAEEMMSRLWGPLHPETRTPMRARAELLESLGRSAEAAGILERLIPAESAERGPDDPILPWMQVTLGRARLHGGRLEEAAGVLREAVDACEAGLSDPPVWLHDEARGALAEVLIAQAQTAAGAHGRAALPQVRALVREAEGLLDGDGPAVDHAAPLVGFKRLELAEHRAATERRRRALLQASAMLGAAEDGPDPGTDVRSR